MPDSDSTQLAVLIDADNSAGRRTAAILAELAKYGTLTVKRAYGDWTTSRLAQWKDELHRHAISPVQQFAYTTGKNATDSALIIDAMDLLYASHVDAFAIVSSDSDFTRLATRLRESGKVVYGLGRRKTPEAFVAACNRFIYLEVLESPDSSSSADEAGSDADGDGDAGDAGAAKGPDLDRLRSLLTAAIESTARDDGWAALGSVGQYLGRKDASFDARNYGYPRLSELARGQSYLEVMAEGEEGQHSLWVRFKPRATRSRRGSGTKKAASSS